MNKPTMRPGKRGWAILIALLVIIGGTGGWLLLRDDDATATPLTAQASSGTVKQTITASGTIEPARTADLDFAVAGTVTKVYVKAGDTVTKGQPVAAVDDSALVASRTAARAFYSAALTQHSTDVDAGASDVQLAADQTAVLSAKSQLDAAVLAAEDAVLRSTIAGTVSAIDLAVGDVVSGSASGSGSGASGSGSGATGVSNAASTTSTSTSSVSIASTDRYLVDATVSADDAAQVKKGMQAQITVTGGSGTIYGTVSSVGLVAQTSSSGAAVFPVEIAVTGAQKSLYAGTSATASIVVKQTADVLTVSSRAIQTDKSTGATYVMKMVDGKAVKTTVTVGTVYGSSTEISSGLADGDTVQIPGVTIASGSGTTTRNGNGGGSFPSGGQMPGFGSPAGGTGGFPGGGQ